MGEKTFFMGEGQGNPVLVATSDRTAWLWRPDDLYRTDDRGHEWNHIFEAEMNRTLALDAVDDDTAWSLNDSDLLFKSDSGSWR